jgi:glucoside 3-dehydrogenase (cytochrome c) catalytic subunit
MTTTPIEPTPSKKYDVIVVGSGAAGGMAAYTLATAGARVLLLEAGRNVDVFKEFKTMAWDYDDPRRGRLPPGEHEISIKEYETLPRPYAFAREFEHYEAVHNGLASPYTSQFLTDERKMPYSGTPYAWTRVRALGGKTLVWGRVALRLSDYDFKGKSHDGFGEDWPISYADLAPYYDKVDTLLGITGTKENLPQLPDGIFQRPIKLNCGEQILRKAIAPMGRHLIPGRAGVTTDGVVTNRYRSRCMGRGRCGRGCDLQASFNSPAGLIYPAKDTGRCDVRTDAIAAEVLVDQDTNRATGVRTVDRNSKASYEYHARAVVVAASTIESTRLLLNSKSRIYPNGVANSSGVVGHYFCEHIMGPGAFGNLMTLAGRETTNDDGRPTGMYIARFRNLTDKHPDFIRGYGFQGGAGCGEYPGNAHGTPGFGTPFKHAVRHKYPTGIGIIAFGEVLARHENVIDVDPAIVDDWGIPAVRINYQFGDNEKKMLVDMAETAEEMMRATGAENVGVRKDAFLEGASIHELGTVRMGDDPKASVVNSFGQAHDVKNLFVLDGSIFVSAGCQNPTWTILALARRGSEYLVEQLRSRTL